MTERTTHYVVLRKDASEVWDVLGSYPAARAEAAIRAAALNAETGEWTDGEYVAVPLSSWSRVKIETERTVKVNVTPLTEKRTRRRRAAKEGATA